MPTGSPISPRWIRAASALALLAGACGTGDIQPPRRTFTITPPITGVAGNSGGLCPAGQQSCLGVCVDTASNPAHCGGCGRPCPAGSACVASTCGCAAGQALCNGVCADPLQCACPGGWQFCNGACADVFTDTMNCGSCGLMCAAGQICDTGQCRAQDSTTCTGSCGGGRVCQAGTCVCQNAQQFCAGACFDTQTSDEHCGGCDSACEGGKVCAAASCACPEGRTDCDGECVDLQTNVAHCGECDRACMMGDACTAGRCAGPTGDDGCSGEALGVSIAQVAAYQSVKIPIMERQQPVASAARIADVVQGRNTMFRVFVTLDSGFVARELSARLTLINPGSEQQYFAKQMIRTSSTDADSASTFPIFVPPEEIQADTRYAVEIVECGSGATGMLRTPRAPASGDTALEARETGVLKIAIVPVVANSIMPDTSEATLKVYRDYLMAMYPTTEVQLSVVSPLTTQSPINWSGMLDSIRRKRQTDAPATDLYYFGFVKPAATIREYCRGGCTAGVGYVGQIQSGGTRVAVGLAYGDESSAAIMAHEVGHNHGRNHAPCAPGGQIQGVDSRYPYAGASIGVWGYDSRSRELFSPQDTTDIMGYCDQKWVSDYTYQGLVDRVAAINGNQLRLVADELIARWQVMLIDAGGPRWSLPFSEPGEAFGEPELAEILDEAGALVDYATVYRTEISDIGAYTVLVPEPAPGWHSVRVQGVRALAFSEPPSVSEP